MNQETFEQINQLLQEASALEKQTKEFQELRTQLVQKTAELEQGIEQLSRVAVRGTHQLVKQSGVGGTKGTLLEIAIIGTITAAGEIIKSRAEKKSALEQVDLDQAMKQLLTQKKAAAAQKLPIIQSVAPKARTCQEQFLKLYESTATQILTREQAERHRDSQKILKECADTYIRLRQYCESCTYWIAECQAWQDGRHSSSRKAPNAKIIYDQAIITLANHSAIPKITFIREFSDKMTEGTLFLLSIKPQLKALQEITDLAIRTKVPTDLWWNRNKRWPSVTETFLEYYNSRLRFISALSTRVDERVHQLHARMKLFLLIGGGYGVMLSFCAIGFLCSSLGG